MILDDNLYSEIVEYCKLNNIENPIKFIHKLLQKAFMVEKYGNEPHISQELPNDYVKETITEPISTEIITSTVDQIIEKKNKDLYGE